MTTVNPTRQKAARSALGKIFTDSSNVWVIHYSCESFYEIHEGRSPRITSIALHKLDSAQTMSFSIHKVAEIKGVPLSNISEHYDCLEREMLQDFYRHLRNYQQMQYLHWNMRDSNYGFQAIEHRFRVLGGTDVVSTVDVSPNPPKDTDGRREDSGRGWVRELQGRWPGVLG